VSLDARKPSQNWDGSRWQFIPLLRATESEARRPERPLPENLPESAGEDERLISAMYWRQGYDVTTTWDDLIRAAGEGYDIGILPAASGLVIVDCDVKEYGEDGSAYQPFQVKETGESTGSITYAAPVVKRGLDDLKREVAKLGHSPAEIATHAVRTKSGGTHLYYRQNPDVPLESNRHHREEWRVDVICSRNSWCAAPPSSGYAVVKDLPAAVLPAWLAEFLRDVNSHLPPLGGARAVKLAAVASEARSGLRLSAREQGTAPRDLLAAYLAAELELVALGARLGGWNQAAFQCACNFFDLGYSLEAVEEAILGAAPPWNARGRLKIRQTIGSAWNRKNPAGCR